MNTMRVLNGLDPDQDRGSVSSNLGSNSLQMLSADNKSPIARKELISQEFSLQSLGEL